MILIIEPSIPDIPHEDETEGDGGENAEGGDGQQADDAAATPSSELSKAKNILKPEYIIKWTE